MDIGSLNRRIEVLQFFEERDSLGGVVGLWQTVGRVWANIEPKTGSEYFQNQQINAESNVTITMRFYAGISALNRVRYQDKTYEIVAVADTCTEHKSTVLTCKEITNNGI